jgi:hypothetical protein
VRLKRAIDSIIDEFAVRLESAGIVIAPIDGARWIDTLEQGLPKRLPPSFSSLVRRYTFAPFEWGPLFFFGNSKAQHEHDLPAAVLRDRAMWNTTLRAGFIRFAQSAGGNYDAVCFDARAPQRNREFRIVRLDHESILIKQQIDVREEIAPSFVALVESLLASRSVPVADG